MWGNIGMLAQESVGGHDGLLIVPGFWQANPRC
jgi:hypothetical protein